MYTDFLSRPFVSSLSDPNSPQHDGLRHSQPCSYLNIGWFRRTGQYFEGW